MSVPIGESGTTMPSSSSFFSLEWGNVSCVCMLLCYNSIVLFPAQALQNPWAGIGQFGRKGMR